MSNIDDDKLVGEVIWFTKTYGFIKQEGNQQDIFVHFSGIISEGFKVLYKGQKVSYRIGLNKYNSPIAIDVLLLKQ